jgi:hypothetical protein
MLELGLVLVLVLVLVRVLAWCWPRALLCWWVLLRSLSSSTLCTLCTLCSLPPACYIIPAPLHPPILIIVAAIAVPRC